LFVLFFFFIFFFVLINNTITKIKMTKEQTIQ
jgi:hypothetical protein